MRDVETNRARATTETLCIMAEDDVVISMEKSLEVYNFKLGGKSFVYPARLGKIHFIILGTGDQYSDAMMTQIVEFYLTGFVQKQRFLEKHIELFKLCRCHNRNPFKVLVMMLTSP